MTDVVHPDIVLPSETALRRAFERGEMILDVLLGHGVPIAFATTRVLPRLITPREHIGRLFGVSRTTAVLELEETIHVTSGEVVHHSRDLFGPGGMDLHVVRALDVERPAQVNPAAENGPARRTRRAAGWQRRSAPAPRAVTNRLSVRRTGHEAAQKAHGASGRGPRRRARAQSRRADRRAPRRRGCSPTREDRQYGQTIFTRPPVKVPKLLKSRRERERDGH